MKNLNAYFVFSLALSISAIVLTNALWFYYKGTWVLQVGDIINLASAYILAVILYATILPILREPKLKFSDQTREPFIKIDHPDGNFRIRVLHVAIENGEGILGDSAEQCCVGLRLKEGSIITLPWQYLPRHVIKLRETIHPESPQELWDALSGSLFAKRAIDINQGGGYFITVGFSMETTGNFYFAYEEPQETEVDLNKLRVDSRGRGMMFEPFQLAISARNLKKKIYSRTYFLMGHSWDTIMVNYPTQVKPLGRIRIPEEPQPTQQKEPEHPHAD